MKVHEMIEWLKAFEDQDATVKVLHNEGGGGYYAQCGVTREVVFDPCMHTDYTDLRNNQFADAEQRAKCPTILLGLDDN